MAKDTAIETSFSFIGGLNTEASVLNYPENASRDELNMELERNGLRKKRLGMDRKPTEAYSELLPSSPNDIALQTYTWESVGSDPTVIIFLVQRGQYLDMYDKGIDDTAVVSVRPLGSIDLADFQVGPNVGLFKVSFAEAKGRLIVAGEAINPFFVDYDPLAGGVSTIPTTISDTTTIELKDVTSTGTHSIVYDSDSNAIYAAFMTGSVGGISSLFKYDVKLGTTQELTTSSPNNTSNRAGIIPYASAGGADAANNRICWFSREEVHIINPATFSINSTTATADIIVTWLKESNDYLIFMAGNTFVAWKKTDLGTFSRVTQTDVPATYALEDPMCSIKGQDYVLKLLTKGGALAACTYTPDGAGGTAGTAKDWAGTVAASIFTAWVYDSTSNSCWFLYRPSGVFNYTLVNCEVDGTYIATYTTLGNLVLTAEDDGNPGDTMVYDEGMHALVIRISDSNIRIYDIANDTVTTIATTNNSQKVGFSNTSGQFFSGSIDFGGTTNLFIDWADLDPPTGNVIHLEVRDFEGVQDGLDIDNRPTTLSGLHEYNLRNQGWPTWYRSVVRPGDDDDEKNANTFDPVSFTKEDIGVYPSNADQIQLGKASNVFKAKRLNYYSGRGLQNNVSGNTQAPKGHFIYRAFNMDRSNGKTLLTSIDSSYNTTTDSRPSTVEFYAGRAWFSGVNDAEFSDHLYYSQILENMSFISKCYQEADPTSETISDLIDTDGGVIKLAGAKKITVIKALDDVLVAGAVNGIWSVSGPSSSGFKATDNQSTKISSVGMASPQSAVDVEGTLMYWSNGGIYAVIPDESTGDLKSVSITAETIQEFYNDISAEGKETAEGYYDAANKKVIWLYKDSSEDYLVYNKSLVYDTLAKAFTPNEFESGATLPRIYDVASFVLGDTTADIYDVIDGSNDVVDGTNDVVDTVAGGTAQNVEKSVHYLTVWPDGTDWKYTFSDLITTSFKDWADTGSNYHYDAYLETGYKVKGDAIRAKQTPIIGVICERTETNWSFLDDGEEYINPSSCLMTTKWDFYENTASNKWSDPRQVYKFRRYVAPVDDSTTFENLYPDIVVTKNKVRGRGKSLKIKFASEDAKDLKLLGWQIFWSGNTNP